MGDTWHVRAMCQAHRKKEDESEWDERRNLTLVLAVERNKEKKEKKKGNKEKKEKKESERKRKEKKLVVLSLIFGVSMIETRWTKK